MAKDRIIVIGQNMTEGPILPMYREADLLILQEASPDQVNRGLGEGWRIFFAPTGQDCIAWKRSVWTKIGDGQYHRMHGSGQGDPDIPDGVKTPARGLLEQHLRHDKTEIPCQIFGLHLLNSWNPLGPGDRWTDDRRKIVMRMEMPVVRRQFAQCVERNQVGISEGDWNSIKAQLNFKGWRQKPTRGLDRFHYTADKRIRCISVEEGPKTGVGNQLRHHALIATFALRG